MADLRGIPVPGDPAQAKRTALIISAAMAFGVLAFAFFVWRMVPLDAPATGGAAGGDPIPLAKTFLVIGVACAFASAFAGRRMHTDKGDREERTQLALKWHIMSQALAEAPCFLGLVLVMMTKTWDSALPAALGFASLLMGVIRALFVFGRLQREW